MDSFFVWIRRFFTFFFLFVPSVKSRNVEKNKSIIVT